MNALRVYRTDKGPSHSRFYLDGRRVSAGAFENAHFLRVTDSYATRTTPLADGTLLVRHTHCIRRGRA